MVSSRDNFSRYQLPDVIDPPETVCFVIRVPKDRWHLAAFYGALFDLTQWINWFHDGTHAARDASRVWKRIWQALEPSDCTQPLPPLIGEIVEENMALRVDCNCNVFVDCCDGSQVQLATVKQTTSPQQPNPQPQPAQGACSEIDVVLQANNKYLLPFGVGSGDTVTITELAGGWYDGGLSPWQCPTSTEYLLGTCGTVNAPTQSGDPCNTIPHMALIAKDSNGNCYDARSGFTIASGVLNGSQLVFQGNDSDITNNAGSVSFHVKICKAATSAQFYAMNYGRCKADDSTSPNYSHTLIPTGQNVQLTSYPPDTCTSAGAYSIMDISFAQTFDANGFPQNPSDIRFKVNSFSISGNGGNPSDFFHVSYGACQGGSGTTHNDLTFTAGEIDDIIHIRSQFQFIVTINISPCV